MSISGFIAEYNPFHNGHYYHLYTSKEITQSEYTIAIMGGHFLQRGEPAIFNKWIRTKMALEAGIDIVIELPTIYSCQSAEVFSYGAVQLLEKLGIINYLVFGCETKNIKGLEIISNTIANEPASYKNLLKKELTKGLSFPSARALALKQYYTENNTCNFPNNIELILQQPNNILAIEYMKWLNRFESKIIPKTILRIGSNYHEKKIHTNFSSATAIRNQILSENNDLDCIKKLMPSSSLYNIKEALNENFVPGQLENLSKSMLSSLLRSNTRDLKKIFDISEGLENRIYKNLDTNSIQELIGFVKTKRYTYTRIQRILCHHFLNIYAEDLELFKEYGGAQYIRILGFTKKGKDILPRLKSKSTLPIITNLSKSYKKLNSLQRKMIDFDILATNLYHVHFTKASTYSKNMDFTYSPMIIENPYTNKY